MRVLLASVDFSPHRDGVSRLSYHHARRLAERGHEVHVVAPHAPGAAAEDAGAPFRTYRFPGYGLGPLRFFPFAWCVLRAIRRTRPDLVLPMNIGYGGVLLALIPRAWRPRYACFAYAYEFLKVARWPLVRRFYNRIYAGAVAVVAISAFTRDALVRFGVAPARIHTVLPGVEVDPASPAGAVGGAGEGRGCTIGTCSRLIARKGHDLVLRALPALLARVPNLRYRIAGDGPARAGLEALAVSLGVRGAVEFLGVVPDAQLGAFYRALDIFVMPARDDRAHGHVEGFGLVYLEAAREGVPSVAARTGGVPEAVLDGETGLLVAPEDVEGLAEALLRLATNPAERLRLGRAACERVRRELNWDGQVDKVEAVLLAAAGFAAPALTGLRVAVLTRTGRRSGLRMARAVEESGHRLVGILAERRGALLWRSLRRLSLKGFVARYGVRLMAARAAEWVRLRFGQSGGRARRAAAGSTRVTPIVVRALNAPEAVRILQAWRADVLVVANAPVLRPEVFAACRVMALNFHSGHLPEYGGVESEFWVLYDGRASATATIHRVAAQLDSGAIYAEAELPIGAADTPETLHERLIEAGAGALVEVLDRIARGDLEPRRTPGPAVLKPWPTAAERRALPGRRRVFGSGPA